MTADSFKDAPQTIGEIRSDKSQCARDWSPRDLLINLLREIDRGDTRPTDLVLFFREELNEFGGARTRFRNACRDNHVALGLVEDGKFRMFRSREES